MPSLRWLAPSAFEGSAAGTSSGGNSNARLPGEDLSKISPSFWLVCLAAFLIRSFKLVPVKQPILAVRSSALQRLRQCSTHPSREVLDVRSCRGLGDAHKRMLGQFRIRWTQRQGADDLFSQQVAIHDPRRPREFDCKFVKKRRVKGLSYARDL